LEFAPKNADDASPFAIRLQYTRASVNNLDYNTGGVNLEWAFNKAIATLFCCKFDFICTISR
ncbi:MAG: hypothetical protein ACK45T_26435, partial [Pseudanabaena sp.]